MYSIKLHFRPSKRPGCSEGKLFLRLIYYRQSGNITLPYKIDRSEWDPQNQRLIPGAALADRTAYLHEVQKRVDREVEELHRLISGVKEEKEMLIRDLLAIHRSRSSGGGLTTFVDLLVRELISEKRERTARAYQTVWRRVLLYSGRKDLSAGDFTAGFIKGFERLLQRQKCTLNTISFYMRNLRAIYNKGVKRGYFPGKEENLFREVYTKVAVTTKRALSKEEIRKLENLLINSSYKLEKVEAAALSLFLFSFHARGMSFVDMAYLRKSDIKKGKLSYFRKKTGQYIEMKLTSPMQEYIRQLPTPEHSPYLFPLIRNGERNPYKQYCNSLRKQNLLLKQVAAKAGIQKSISTHQARHAWATIAKKENIPVWVISEGLGHTSLSTTYIYLDSFNASVLDRAHKKVSDAVRRVG